MIQLFCIPEHLLEMKHNEVENYFLIYCIEKTYITDIYKLHFTYNM